MQQYLTLLKETIPGITTEDLFAPRNESGLHSLDSIVIRGALETHFGFEIPDEAWYRFGSLSDTLKYCHEQKALVETVAPRISCSRSTEIRLPQMANRALSENWLLKEIGDMHWEMLSKGLEQKSSEFADRYGNRLYAAFARVNYAISPLNQFKENQLLDMEGQISRFSNCAYYSNINGNSGEHSFKAELMSSFSARKENNNAKMMNEQPKRSVNHIGELSECPEFYMDHRKLNKGKADEVFAGGYHFKIKDTVMEELEYDIDPGMDVNGVGLLYFAAYPMIADRCASVFFRHTMNMKNYDLCYHTIFRDVFYFANCNPEDRVIVKLNSVEHMDHNKLKMTASLYRESDNKLMARVLTVKQRWDSKACGCGE